MKSSSQARVHGAIATHLGIEPEAIEDEQRLGPDLGLRALDLVLIALRMESRTPGRQEFPVHRLAPSMTVRDLEALCETWWRLDAPAEEDAPATLRSMRRPPLSSRHRIRVASRAGR